MYRMVDIVQFERKLQSHNAAVKCHHAANQLKDDILRVDRRNQSSNNHYKHGVANVNALFAWCHVEIDLEERVREDNQRAHRSGH